MASGGIFKYTTYDREVPDTFNMCLDYPEKLSIVIPCSLANDYPPEAAIRGDEGTLTLQNPGEWNVGFDSVTVVPRKGRRSPGPKDVTPPPLHWQNFIRLHPDSGKAGQRCPVRARDVLVRRVCLGGGDFRRQPAARARRQRPELAGQLHHAAHHTTDEMVRGW